MSQFAPQTPPNINQLLLMAAPIFVELLRQRHEAAGQGRGQSDVGDVAVEAARAAGILWWAVEAETYAMTDDAVLRAEKHSQREG